MAKCENCGNEYDKTLEIRWGGAFHVYDCFECAIHALAPICPTCGTHIIGHGLEAEDKIFCCAHCARRQGEQKLKDRA